MRMLTRCRIDGRDAASARRELDRLLEHRRRRVGDGRPGELRADPSCLGAAAASSSGSSTYAQTASASAAGSANGTIVPAPDASMSCAYQYGVETTAQPAAMPKVSAPDEICSRSRYGVTKTSVAASRSAISSIGRKRSSNST